MKNRVSFIYLRVEMLIVLIAQGYVTNIHKRADRMTRKERNSDGQIAL